MSRLVIALLLCFLIVVIAQPQASTSAADPTFTPATTVTPSLFAGPSSSVEFSLSSAQPSSSAGPSSSPTESLSQADKPSTTPSTTPSAMPSGTPTFVDPGPCVDNCSLTIGKAVCGSTFANDITNKTCICSTTNGFQAQVSSCFQTNQCPAANISIAMNQTSQICGNMTMNMTTANTTMNPNAASTSTSATVSTTASPKPNGAEGLTAGLYVFTIAVVLASMLL